MSFETLGLSAALLRAVSDQGYDTPTPIQAKAIPAVLEGRDVMAAAQTGTGKTAGFTLPMLHLLSERSQPKFRRVRALVLTPTRELAAQVMESVQTYGKHLPLKATAIFGGVNINPQIGALRRGVDIVVATPGRLLDHLDQGTLDLSGVQMLVLDEADRMLDMGFIRDIQRILKILPKQRQNMMFSATFSNEIGKLAHSMLHQPVSIEVAPRNTATELVTQVVHTVDRNKKRELLSWLIGSKNWQQVLVFARTKHGCDRLAKQLEMDGLRAAAIHGNKTQNARTRALADFKRGKVRVLVATDIAARGLDIDHLPHVVNYELPNVPEDYVHRIGRTGRAGKEGCAASLVCVDELKLLKDIERVLNRSIPQEVIEGFEADMSVRPEPIFKKPRGGSGQNSGQRNGGGGSSHKRQHSRNAKPGGNKRQGQRRNQGSSR